MTFGERLKKLREMSGMNQSELANRAKVARPVIVRLEAGQRSGLTLESARRLARALGVSLDYLAGDSTFGETDAEEEESLAARV